MIHEGGPRDFFRSPQELLVLQRTAPRARWLTADRMILATLGRSCRSGPDHPDTGGLMSGPGVSHPSSEYPNSGYFTIHANTPRTLLLWTC